MLSDKRLLAFVKESNAIEGINRTPSRVEINATRYFLESAEIKIENLEKFVSAIAPFARLRLEDGMDVRIGNHIPPAGGPSIGYALDELLVKANGGSNPYKIHCEYEKLHPFMDGNGRSGRVLWAWQMIKTGNKLLQLGFLHAFYYQTLDDR